jgi:hypothetical protein
MLSSFRNATTVLTAALAGAMPLNAAFGAEATAKTARVSSPSAETQKSAVDEYEFAGSDIDRQAALYSEQNDGVGITVSLGKREIDSMRQKNYSPQMVQETLEGLVKKGGSASMCRINRSKGDNTVVVFWVNGGSYKEPLTGKVMLTLNGAAAIASDVGRYSRAVKDAIKPSVAALQ